MTIVQKYQGSSYNMRLGRALCCGRATMDDHVTKISVSSGWRLWIGNYSEDSLNQ